MKKPIITLIALLGIVPAHTTHAAISAEQPVAFEDGSSIKPVFKAIEQALNEKLTLLAYAPESETTEHHVLGNALFNALRAKNLDAHHVLENIKNDIEAITPEQQAKYTHLSESELSAADMTFSDTEKNLPDSEKEKILSARKDTAHRRNAAVRVNKFLSLLLSQQEKTIKETKQQYDQLATTESRTRKKTKSPVDLQDEQKKIQDFLDDLPKNTPPLKKNAQERRLAKIIQQLEQIEQEENNEVIKALLDARETANTMAHYYENVMTEYQKLSHQREVQIKEAGQ